MDTPTRSFRFDRWWGLAAGIAFAIGDTLFAHWADSASDQRPRRAFLTGCYFGSSFAMLGFGLGWLVEARRHERAQAAIIRTQVGEITATRQRLAQQEKLAALGELATAIAHEVRNPLAVIRSAAQGLAETERPDGAAIHHATDFVIAEIDRLTSVVNALLAFVRPPKVAAGIVAVDDLFDRALLLARDDLDAKGIRVARGETGRVPARRRRRPLARCSSGSSRTPSRRCRPAKVGLGARAARARSRSTSPTGPDRPDVRERVFNPFFTTRPRPGLAVVARQFIEASGGTVAAGDRAGGGARFTLRLPTGRGATKAA